MSRAVLSFLWQDDAMPTTRARRREDVTARVLEIGRAHLAEHGAAGLSLRAVTRDLGMVSSAVYRYVANRDELLTLLLVDAYGDQADAVDAAVSALADQPWHARVLAGAHAFRTWAVAEPSRYALLYGSPVPGYAAPPEVTIEPGTRVIGTVLALVAEGVAAGEVPDGPAPHDPPEPLAADLRAVAAEVGMGTHPAVLSRALLLWSTMVGGTSLEVFGQYGADTFRDPGQAYDQQVQMAVAVLRGTLDQP
jgi:AcrR family transcriptional regulator